MASKMYGFNVCMADVPTAEMLKVIVSYEATRRGTSQGQVLEQIVAQAADLDSYPEEIREHLDEIAERRRRRAIEDSLSAGRRARIA